MTQSECFVIDRADRGPPVTRNWRRRRSIWTWRRNTYTNSTSACRSRFSKA